MVCIEKQKYKWHAGCSVIKQAGKENHSVSDNSKKIYLIRNLTSLFISSREHFFIWKMYTAQLQQGLYFLLITYSDDITREAGRKWTAEVSSRTSRTAPPVVTPRRQTNKGLIIPSGINMHLKIMTRHCSKTSALCFSACTGRPLNFKRSGRTWSLNNFYS